MIRPLVLGALRSILVDGAAADKTLEKTFRAHRTLTNDERAAIANTVFRVALHRGTLFWHLHQSLIPDDGRVPADDVEALLTHFESPPPSPSWPDHPVDNLAARRSLPRWLAALWAAEIEDADALAAVTNEPGPVTLRANLLKTTRDALLDRLQLEGVRTEIGRHSPTALHVRGRANIFGLPAWREGLFEVQDEASQCVIDACHASPGEVVLDWCAGSGGKTLGLAAGMRNMGAILAADVEPKRLADLSPRLRRAGVSIVTTQQHPSTFPTADMVLVDAPCSSLGTLRRGPDVRWRTRWEDVLRFPELQRRILNDAVPHVRPGGRLVYATCTLHRAENDDVAAWLTQAHPSLTLEDTRTLLPHRDGTDGFFIARFVRAP